MKDLIDVSLAYFVELYDKILNLKYTYHRLK